MGGYGGIPRAHGMRPYIHVNRSPNNLRKPTSDLKLIVLTEVSELASESWLHRLPTVARTLCPSDISLYYRESLAQRQGAHCAPLQMRFMVNEARTAKGGPYIAF